MRARDAGSGTHSDIPIEDVAISEYIQGGRARYDKRRANTTLWIRRSATLYKRKILTTARMAASSVPAAAQVDDCIL